MNPAYLRPVADHLWESTVFACAAGLLTLCLEKNGARIRYWLWLIASFKFLIPLSVLVALGGHLAWRIPPPEAAVGLPAVVEEVAQPFTSVGASGPPNPPMVAAVSPIPAVLFAIWGCGFGAIGLSWWMRWLQIRATVQGASPVELPIPIRARRSPTVLEPSVFGVIRPVLLLPAGIIERLTPVQLDAVIAHELCHARYRDNLAAALHMFVETVFWFHPLVWWIGKRMVAERERACDEEVLARGNNAESYAEAILKVCRYGLETSSPYTSSIGGADLRRRISAIVTPRVVKHLDPIKIVLLAALAVASVGGPMTLGLLQASRAGAQERTPASMSFDVVSIKLFTGGFPSSFAMQRSGGRIRWTNTLMGLVMYAYRIEAFQETGMRHVPYEFYVLDAETSPDATDDQLRLMVQSLLADRFKFQAHRETRQLAGYLLVASKNGPKVKATAPDDPPAPLPEWFAKGGEKLSKAIEGKMLATMEGKGISAITGRRVTIAQLVQTLEEQLRAPVTDQTGLAGQYYFAFKCVQADAPPGADSDAPISAPSLFTALRETLGLQLEKQTVPVAMLIVDHVEKTPTEN